MFDEEADLFTVIVRKGEATGQTKLFKMENVKFKKYAHIPKSCQACSKDLFDHQLYHKIFHSRCKFCRDDSCFIENCVTFADVKTTKKDVETQHEKTPASKFLLQNMREKGMNMVPTMTEKFNAPSVQDFFSPRSL